VRRGVYRSSSDSGSDGASPNMFCWFCRTPESGLCRIDGSENGEDVRTPDAGEADQARWPYDGFGGVKPLDVEAVGGVDGLNESRPKKGLLDAWLSGGLLELGDAAIIPGDMVLGYADVPALGCMRRELGPSGSKSSGDDPCASGPKSRRSGSGSVRPPRAVEERLGSSPPNVSPV
jgi:hypothetical protein